MSGERTKPTNSATDLALLINATAEEHAALVGSLQEAAGLLDGLEGALRRSFARGLAEQYRAAGDANHDVARALEALAEESGAEAPTHRDLAISRRKAMKAQDTLSIALYGGAVSLMSMQPLGPIWSILAGAGVGLVGFLVARFTPYQTPPKEGDPK